MKRSLEGFPKNMEKFVEANETLKMNEIVVSGEMRYSVQLAIKAI